MLPTAPSWPPCPPSPSQVAGGAAAASAGGAAPAPPLRDMWAVTFRDLPDYMYLLQRQDHKARVSSCSGTLGLLWVKGKGGGEVPSQPGASTAPRCAVHAAAVRLRLGVMGLSSCTALREAGILASWGAGRVLAPLCCLRMPRARLALHVAGWQT